MANHPNRSRTYWYNPQRGFANEYEIGIATTRESAKDYEARGYQRIDRNRALRELTNRGDAATKIYANVVVDGAEGYDRFDVARALRSGGAIHPIF